MQKLKVAANSARIRGWTFCKTAGRMTPRKQIVIKGLVRKCPQWGYVVVDGQLVEWER
ncbi:hypothetical protein [Nostoc flagelliforme]|uniref:hypothetical protein n=1 Tax=Nostoc flagelliforme TaxID=1306274 RepID=UPI001F550FA9|nr:hypothetical protein [Nostoc flagelliforme]